MNLSIIKYSSLVQEGATGFITASQLKTAQLLPIIKLALPATRRSGACWILVFVVIKDLPFLNINLIFFDYFGFTFPKVVKYVSAWKGV